MGSNLNFKNYGNEPPGNGGGGDNNKPLGNFPLTRQSSIYSLRFDEFQSSIGKDFGSMNMDELLKNIWSAEESQTVASTSGGVGGSAGGGGGSQEGLKRQGSLTLPRTLSQKTVDEVWRDLSKEYTAGKDGNSNGGGSAMPQKQPTLGEITLEEFLVRAGVVREETQSAGKVSNGGFFGNHNGTTLGIGFQEASSMVSNLMGNNPGPDRVNQFSVHSSNLPLDVNGARSNHQQQQQQQTQPRLQQQQRLQQPIFPKQPTFGYVPQMPLHASSQVGSPGIRSGIVGIGDQGMGISRFVQSNALSGSGLGLAGGLGGGPIAVATRSPVTPVSSDGVGKSNGDTSSVSPVPYMFRGVSRGRRSSGTVEKVVERRQRRMIKNRESAARSRARKQAYTMELEAELAKLKEENQELRRKQVDMMQMQKDQGVETMNKHGGPRKRLRRTQTGPW